MPNIIQQQDSLKGLPDQALQRELMSPSGAMPSYLVLSELQRRKSMRDNYSAMQKGAPTTSMAEEFTKGVGQADVGNYSPAVREAMPGGAPSALPTQGQPMAFAAGGHVPQGYARMIPMAPPATPAELAKQAQDAEDNEMSGMFKLFRRKQDDVLDPGMGLIRGIQEGDSLGDILTNTRGLGGPELTGLGGILRGDSFGTIAGNMGKALLGPAGGFFFAEGGPVGGNFMEAAGVGPNQGTDRTFLGPGTPDPMGRERTYFGMKPPTGPTGPVEPGPLIAQGLGALAPIVMAMVDGSANGGTGNSSGTVGGATADAGGTSAPGVDGGTGGVGGSASSDAGVGGSAAAGVGGDDGGTYAQGGVVRYQRGGGVMPHMDEENALTNVPDVPESYIRDTRTLKQRFEDAMRVRSKDIGSLAVEGLARGAGGIGDLPWRDWYEQNRKMVDTERQMEDKFWAPDPGKSLGQSIADKLNNRGPGMRRDVGETGGQPEIPQMVFLPPGESGETGEFPAGLPVGGQGWGGPDPMLAGDVNAGQGNVVPPPPVGVGGASGLQAGPPGVGGGGSGAGGPGTPINIGGEGLADYVNQIRALQRGDGFDAMERRNREDRDRLEGGRNSDRGLALLTAGLGIMGGTSPFAAVNIGQGAQAGVKQWNEATREMRRAERDIRNAEDQITIARANRDERQLEKGVTLYAKAQEAMQRSLDRQNAAGIAASNRAENRGLKKMELESLERDREERREQARVSDLGTRANQYGREADALDVKAATLSANIAAGPETAAEVARIKAQADALRKQAEVYGKMYGQAIVDREIRSGRLAAPKSEQEYKALKPGTRYLHSDGNIKVKP